MSGLWWTRSPDYIIIISMTHALMLSARCFSSSSSSKLPNNWTIDNAVIIYSLAAMKCDDRYWFVWGWKCWNNMKYLYSHISNQASSFLLGRERERIVMLYKHWSDVGPSDCYCTAVCSPVPPQMSPRRATRGAGLSNYPDLLDILHLKVLYHGIIPTWMSWFHAGLLL